MRDVISYIWANIDKGSLYAYLGIFTLIALLGLIVPYITKSMFADVAVSGNMVALIAISIFMISVSLGRMLFGTIRDLFLERIALKLDQTVEAATMMRILALPTGFFGNYASGDLSTRINYMNLLVTQLINIGLSTGLTVLLSFIYIIQIFHRYASYHHSYGYGGCCKHRHKPRSDGACCQGERSCVCAYYRY